jgi:hypothetical protein
MNRLTTLALAAALTGGALPVHAADRDMQVPDVCRSELQAYYGEDAHIDVVQKRQFEMGTRLTLAARIDVDNSRFATCWVSREDSGNFDRRETSQRVAATAPVDAER